ncbi:MAG: bifunctional adenosylcobinamide kinase/adenosylcobinamide-phosphate guanylyltransferase [Paracoccaceae bacterium]
MSGGLTLVLGGARSGKSALAERQCRALTPQGRAPVYIATAQAWDDEMRARIDLHRRQRADAGWITIEEPTELPGALRSAGGAAVLIDCLTLWVTNLMMADLDDADVHARFDGLARALAGHEGPVVAVANEVGLGIVPDNAMARRFRDLAGRLNQQLAAQSDTVVFAAAGLPLVLKGKLAD